MPYSKPSAVVYFFTRSGDVKDVILTDYLKYRAKLRSFDLGIVEEIVRFSTERYFDTETGRNVAVGMHRDKLVAVPYEEDDAGYTPVTVHAITRQQIRFRVNTGRFR